MSITDSMDMSLSKLREVVKDREAWHAAIHGVTKSRTWLNDWPTMKRKHVLYLCSSKHSHAHSLLLASTISMLCVSFITYTCQKHTHTKTHFWFWHIFVFLFSRKGYEASFQTPHNSPAAYECLFSDQLMPDWEAGLGKENKAWKVPAIWSPKWICSISLKL